MSSPCLQVPESQWVASNALAFAIRDRYPVSEEHTLVILRRHVATWFDATPEEQRALFELVDVVKRDLDASLRPAGYNIGINVGEAAGQTVFHLHVHVIPRYLGDVTDPRGGVRHVIPGKGNYPSYSPSPDISTPHGEVKQLPIKALRPTGWRTWMRMGTRAMLSWRGASWSGAEHLGERRGAPSTAPPQPRRVALVWTFPPEALVSPLLMSQDIRQRSPLPHSWDPPESATPPRPPEVRAKQNVSEERHTTCD